MWFDNGKEIRSSSCYRSRYCKYLQFPFKIYICLICFNFQISDIQSHLEEANITEKTTNYYQRTSTPILERRRCTIQSSRKDGYEKWCNRLEKPESVFKVRGIPVPPKGFISSNLIPFTSARDNYEVDTSWYEENPANQRLDFHSDAMKKLLLSVVSDHCKSLLKKTISFIKSNDKSRH